MAQLCVLARGSFELVPVVCLFFFFGQKVVCFLKPWLDEFIFVAGLIYLIVLFDCEFGLIVRRA